MSEQLPYAEFKSFKETSSPRQAQELVSKGWVVLNICTRDYGDPQKVIEHTYFMLGAKFVALDNDEWR